MSTFFNSLKRLKRENIILHTHKYYVFIGTITTIIAITLLLVFRNTQSHAATITWDGGAGDTLWSTAQNWDGDILPTTVDTVFFDSTNTSNVTIDSSIDIHVELANAQKKIEDYLGLDNATLIFDFSPTNGKVRLDLITVNPRHNQSFLFHTSEGYDKLDVLKNMFLIEQPIDLTIGILWKRTIYLLNLLRRCEFHTVDLNLQKLH